MSKFDVLLEYQDIDVKITAIQAKLMKSKIRAELLKKRKYLVDSQDVLKRLEAEAGEIRINVDTVVHKHENAIIRLTEIENIVNDEKEQLRIREVEHIVHEQQDLSSALGKLEKELAAIVNRLDKIESDIRIMAGKYPTIKKEYATLKAEYDKELAIVKGESKPFEEKLQELEKDINKVSISRYKSAKRKHKHPIVPVTNKMCKGCNMDLPYVVLKKIKESDVLLECENCGRLLYYSE